MKSRFINIISLILLFTVLSDASLNKEKTPVLSNSYFPVNNSIELIYNSSFGECITTYTQDGEKYKVNITGKVLGNEILITKAGRFKAIKFETIVESSSDTKNRVTEWYSEWYTEGVGLVKAKLIIEGGGFIGFIRNILEYGTIEFELKEIRNK